MMMDPKFGSLSDISFSSTGLDLPSLDPMSSQDLRDLEQNLGLEGEEQNGKPAREDENANKSVSDNSNQFLMLAPLSSLGGPLESVGSGMMTVDPRMLFSNESNNKRQITPPTSPVVRKKAKRDWNKLEMQELQASMITEPRQIVAKPTLPRRASPGDFVYVQRTDIDVLLGRGDRSTRNPGNIRYLKVKDQMQERYLNSTKEGKTPISQELVDVVHGWGGRFLKLDNATQQWYEIDDKRARKKCSQALRDINTPQARLKKRQKYPRKKKN